MGVNGMQVTRKVEEKKEEVFKKFLRQIPTRKRKRQKRMNYHLNGLREEVETDEEL